RPAHAADLTIRFEDLFGRPLPLLGVERERRTARAEIKELRHRLVPRTQERPPHEADPFGLKVGQLECGADRLRKLEADEVLVRLTLWTDGESLRAEHRLRMHHGILPRSGQTPGPLHLRRVGAIASEV